MASIKINSDILMDSSGYSINNAFRICMPWIQVLRENTNFNNIIQEGVYQIDGLYSKFTNAPPKAYNANNYIYGILFVIVGSPGRNGDWVSGSVGSWRYQIFMHHETQNIYWRWNDSSTWWTIHLTAAS